MEHTSAQNLSETFTIKDAFEIRAEHGVDHPYGLVVVLDKTVKAAVGDLCGLTAVFMSPDESTRCIAIDEAKDHLAATSLFFKGIGISDLPKEAKVTITVAVRSVSK